MRHHFAAVAILTLFLGTQCQKSDSDIAEVKNVAASFKEALASHDASKLTPLLTSDVTDYDLSEHTSIFGRDNVANFLACQIEAKNKPDITIQIEHLKHKGPDLIHAIGLFETSTQTEQIAFSVDFKKEENSWKIAQITHLLLQPAPSQYEHLKGLNWLTGSWTNQDEGTSFTTTYGWGANKNFLKQQFNLQILGHKQLSGEQIIGWDPTIQAITSWIFDSDGGFGQGSWFQDGDNWYVTTKFTLSDGRKSSATYVYSPVDADTYTFSSIQRDVDGDILPNIGPFIAVKTSRGTQ